MGAAGHYKPDFGPTPADFAKSFRAKFNIGAGYHAAGRVRRRVLLQQAIEKAGSIDPDKVAAALNEMDVTTFFGPYKFATDPESTACRSGIRWCSRSGR